MFNRKCPSCGKELEKVFYVVFGRKLRYFKCSCGWTNKPQEAGGLGSVTYAHKTEAVGNQSDSECTDEDSPGGATI